MPKRMITVTAKHILEGEPDSYGHCPVALALRDAGFFSPGVASEDLRFDFWESDSPPEVRAFIQMFDADLPVEPFTFELAWEEEW